MTKTKLLAPLFALVAFAACDNETTVTRTSATPMVVEQKDVEVTLYRTETRLEIGGPCGFEPPAPGRPPVPRTCPITTKVKIRDERLSFRVYFPQGSELKPGQTEKAKVAFVNEGEAGFVSVKIESKFNRYDNNATKKIPVAYGQMNEIFLRLR
jgi:hypothetical protein